jgi:hypothetical protein
VLDEEDGNAIVGSPCGKQGISLVKCRVHHNTSKNDQADAERWPSAAARDQHSSRSEKVTWETRYRAVSCKVCWAAFPIEKVTLLIQSS